MSNLPSKEHMIRGKVVPSLITAAILSFVATVIPGGWNWVFAKCHAAWFWFFSSATIPIWLLILLSALSLVALAFVAYAVAHKAANHAAQCYAQDTIFGIRWRWHCGHHGISDLASFCPRCDLQVNARQASPFNAIDAVVYHCDDCHADLHRFDVGQEEVEGLVMRKIQQKIRRESSEARTS